MRVAGFGFLVISIALPTVSVAQDPSGGARDATTGNAPSQSEALEEQDAEQSLRAPYLVRFREAGTWQAGAVDGKPVYGIEGDNIGTASDILIGKDGRVVAVLIEVGGYLGLAAKTVAVKADAFEVAPGTTQAAADDTSARHPAAAPDPNSAAEDIKGISGGTGGNAITDGNDGAVKLGPDGLPERLVARVTRKQLEEAPALE